MNEPLNRIFKESTLREFSEGVQSIHSIEIERFAESIVNECVRYFVNDYVRDWDLLWRDDLSQQIKQHFGVN